MKRGFAPCSPCSSCAMTRRGVPGVRGVLELAPVAPRRGRGIDGEVNLAGKAQAQVELKSIKLRSCGAQAAEVSAPWIRFPPITRGISTGGSTCLASSSTSDWRSVNPRDD